MPDPRRIGHAQRRRIGASPNMYDQIMQPPTYGPGDTVKAKGRYGAQTVTDVIPNVTKPGAGTDGHGYVVQGGKGGRQSTHFSGEIMPFMIGMGEVQ